MRRGREAQPQMDRLESFSEAVVGKRGRRIAATAEEESRSVEGWYGRGNARAGARVLV